MCCIAKWSVPRSFCASQDYTVRQAGIEVGMQDPYHFSKQFKNIVGISPSAFMKQAAQPDATLRSKDPTRKTK